MNTQTNLFGIGDIVMLFEPDDADLDGGHTEGTLYRVLEDDSVPYCHRLGGNVFVKYLTDSDDHWCFAEDQLILVKRANQI